MTNGIPYTPEMAANLQVNADVQISPDGSQVAWTLAPIGHVETHPAVGIFVAPADGSAEPRALTGREQNNSAPRWSPDGSAIAFLSDRVKRGTQQLYVVSPQGGEPYRLTDLPGGAGAPAWMPDGSGLIISATRKAMAGEKESSTEIVVASEQPRPRGLAYVSRQGGPIIPVGPKEGHVWAFAISPDGTRIAAATSPTELLSDSFDNVYLWIGSLDGSTVEQRIGPFGGSTERIIWDGNQIALIASKRPEVQNGCIWLVDATSGDLTRVPDFGMTQGWIGFVHGDLVALGVESQRTRVDKVNLEGEPSLERIALPEPVTSCWLRGVSFSADGQTIACIAEPDTAPGDVWTVAGNRATRLTNSNPQLEHVALTNLEELSWTSTDGVKIDGWLLRPPGAEEGKRLPLVVYVHGGPSYQWGNWFHGTWHDWAHNLAARGFAVLLPNPRGSTGRGEEFTSSNVADLGGMDFVDIMTGVDHVIEMGVADPDRLGIGGWSYGGFITAWAIGHTDRFKAAVAGAAVTNWVSKVGTTDIRRQNESNFSGALHEAPDELWERSPIRYLNNMKTPTLIVHGAADPRVPPTQGVELYLGLKAVGVDTEMVSYPRQKHAFHERAFMLDLLNRICDWYERYL